MNIFNIFRRQRAATWADLSADEKRRAANKIAGVAMSLTKYAMFGGRAYEATKPSTARNRAPSWVEKEGEDGTVSPSERNRIVNMHRHMLRNSPTRVSQDQQIRVHVVGSVGGKMYASFPAEFKSAADEVMEYFNSTWFPRAEFTFRKNFNWILKTCLTAQDTNGNVVLVFDDGILTGGKGTGRIRGFEGDEIANLRDGDAMLKERGLTQRAGFLYNAVGMFSGVILSTSQRGEDEFDASKGVRILTMDPYDDSADPDWICLGDMRRFNQGRAVSPLTAAICALIDLHETAASEAVAAKINSQLVGQILSSAESDTAPSLPAFEDQAAATEQATTINFTTTQLNAIGAHFDQMPEGLKIDLLDTKRPNANMPAYIEFLTGLVGGTRGLARVYATLKAQTSYTAFRGEQVMTQPSFEEAQQDLEREVCDWAARHVIRRAVKLGIIKSPLPVGWERMIAWNWPKMPEVSEKDAQTALSLKLKNGVTSLTRELGPGEMEKIAEEQAREAAIFRAAGLIYPTTETASGQIATETTSEPKTEGEENGKD